MEQLRLSVSTSDTTFGASSAGACQHQTIEIHKEATHTPLCLSATHFLCLFVTHLLSATRCVRLSIPLVLCNSILQGWQRYLSDIRGTPSSVAGSTDSDFSDVV